MGAGKAKLGWQSGGVSCESQLGMGMEMGTGRAISCSPFLCFLCWFIRLLSAGHADAYACVAPDDGVWTGW